MKVKSKKKIANVLIFLVAFLTVSCWSGRNGQQLYTDIFGAPSRKCLQIIRWRDRQTFDDASAWLFFKTCPAEVSRILSKSDYSKTVITKNEAHGDETVTFSGAIPKWWTPSELGDTCIKYEYYNREENAARRLYVSMDQATVYCRDIRMTP